MSTINHQKLRELAFALQRMATPQNYWRISRAMLSPSAVLALLDQLEHAKNHGPAIRLTLHHEIADFCATLEHSRTGTLEAMQQELLQRIDNAFDFSEPVRNQNMHTKPLRHAAIGQVSYSAAPHKTVPDSQPDTEQSA